MRGVTPGDHMIMAGIVIVAEEVGRDTTSYSVRPRVSPYTRLRTSIVATARLSGPHQARADPSQIHVIVMERRSNLQGHSEISCRTHQRPISREGRAAALCPAGLNAQILGAGVVEWFGERRGNTTTAFSDEASAIHKNSKANDPRCWRRDCLPPYAEGRPSDADIPSKSRDRKQRGPSTATLRSHKFSH